MEIVYISNKDDGKVKLVDVADGLTLGSFLSNPERLSEDYNPENYLIQVNRNNADSNLVLRDGDRVSVTPTKIKGAN